MDSNGAKIGGELFPILIRAYGEYFARKKDRNLTIWRERIFFPSFFFFLLILN